MNARPEVREHLLAMKMIKWALIGRRPHAHPECSPAKARRNYARLYARHPQVAQKIGMTALSAYPPL
jgi:hypothetical protein